MTLKNNPNGGELANLGLVSDGTVTSIVINEAFTVPAGIAMAGGYGIAIIHTANMTVNGNLSSVEITSYTQPEATAATTLVINGDFSECEITANSDAPKLKTAVTITGDSITNTINLTNSDLTFNDCLLANLTLNAFTGSTVTFDDVTMQQVIAECVVGTTITFNSSTISSFLMNDNNSGSSGSLDNYSLALAMVEYTGTVQLTNVEEGSSVKKMVITGTVYGMGSTESVQSVIGISNSEYVFEVKDLVAWNILLDIYSVKELLFNYQADIIDFTNGTVVDAATESLAKIKSVSGMKLIVMNAVVSTPVSSVDTVARLCAAVDENGLTICKAVWTFATEGIKSIDDSQRINMVLAGESIDLTKIKVTCESGYHFVGWYYMNEDGIMVKILDPANFIPAENCEIFAMAEADAPNHDYTGFFIGLIVLLVLIVLAAFIGIYLKATERSVQKTAAKKSSKR